jgi:hypothetical protein
MQHSGDSMAATSSRRKAPKRARHRAPAITRSARAVAAEALPAGTFPTPKELEELGRFADRVANGDEDLTYIKL